MSIKRTLTFATSLSTLALAFFVWNPVQGTTPSATAFESDGDIDSSIELFGQGDAGTQAEAYRIAVAACKKELKCSEELKKVGTTTCWRGGENGHVCTVECSCDVPISEAPPEE